MLRRSWVGRWVVPVYEYKCIGCGKEFEVFQRITDDPLETCKFCGGKLRKLISQTTFQLRGSGWYVTDYKGKERQGDATGASKTAVAKEASSVGE